MTTYLCISICLTLLSATQQQFQQFDRCPNGQQCYITPAFMPWSSAQQWCKSMNATLPIVDDSEKQAVLLEAMENLELTVAWIGAKAVYDDWTWVDGSKYGPSMLLFHSAGDFVATMYKSASGVFTTYGFPAIDVSSFICQFSDKDVCNNAAWRSAPTKDGCYIEYNSSVTWFSARNHCLEDGGDLATFHNLSDAAFAFVNYSDSDTLPWIGLRNRWWNWQNAVTGTVNEVLLTQWFPATQPSNTNNFNCIITTSRGWEEAKCTDNWPFICLEVNVFLPENSTVSSMDRNESPVQIGSCKNVGLAAGLGVGIPLIVIAVILIVVIVNRDKLRTPKQVYATSIYQYNSTYDNDSVTTVVPNVSPEQSTQNGRAYDGLDNSQRGTDDEAYDTLDAH